jgi:hypothetical protein
VSALQFDVPSHWVVLRLRPGRDWLVADYRDDTGRRLTVRPDDPSLSAFLAFGSRSLFVHRAALSAIHDLILTLPEQRVGPHAGHPVPLPIFLDVPKGFADEPWEDEFWSSHPALDAERIQIVRLARRRWLARPDPRPPLTVLGIGSMAERSLEQFRERPWLADEQVRRFGLEIRTVDEDAADAIAPYRRDIVITEGSRLKQALGLSGRGRDPRALPRLVIALSDRAGGLYESSVPPGVSLLVVPSEIANPFVSDFLYGVVHDYPLHEAMRAAMYSPRSTRLYSDPVANEDLRLSAYLSTLLREGRELETAPVPGDLGAFLERIDHPAAWRFSVPSASLRLSRNLVDTNLQRVWDVGTDFAQEDTGLRPMSYAAEALGMARDEAALVHEAFARLAADPGVRAEMKQHQERVVDITLERLEHTPLARDLLGHSAAATLWVDDRTVLRSGARYRLLVNIGRRSSRSLVIGDQPPIDPLLPDGPTHRLEVAIFGLDFTVQGRKVQWVSLPELGPSDEVAFTIRAPSMNRRRGPRNARLRVAVYHQNHLVQAYLLSSVVDAEERLGERGTLEVALEVSRSARFTNLEGLRARAFSIGINEGPAGSHRLMIKKGGTATHFNYEASAVSPVVEAFRKRLTKATFRGRAPRYPSGQPVTPEGRGEFETTIRELASLGSGLWNGLMDRAPGSIGSALRILAGGFGQEIQIVRLEATTVVPWSIVYDYLLPRGRTAARASDVCVGWGPGVSPGGPPGKHCDHSLAVAGYCIYGFWGIRHVIEELLPEAVALTADPTFDVTPVSPKSVWLSADVPTDPSVVKLTSTLQTLLAPSVPRLIQPADNLIDLLWDAQQRPSVLVIVGHHETADASGPVPVSRINLPGGGWLEPAELSARAVFANRWGQPNTLAFLMACGSAATKPTTLNDFVLALNSAGAGAVVGTEVTIFAGLAERFASDVASGMWSSRRSSLGEAVKEFRQTLATESNPLGFAFTSYGSADVRVV